MCELIPRDSTRPSRLAPVRRCRAFPLPIGGDLLCGPAGSCRPLVRRPARADHAIPEVFSAVSLATAISRSDDDFGILGLDAVPPPVRARGLHGSYRSAPQRVGRCGGLSLRFCGVAFVNGLHQVLGDVSNAPIRVRAASKKSLDVGPGRRIARHAWGHRRHRQAPHPRSAGRTRFRVDKGRQGIGPHR